MNKREPRAHVHRHRDREIEQIRHDPYRLKRKLREPTVCPSCGAVYQDGRWQWLQRPAVFEEHLCAACRRIRDRYPAGFITLEGSFFDRHRDEVLKLARNEEEREKAEHPLQRIMAVSEEGGKTVITTTDIRIAHKIADAIQQAYQGSLDIKFPPDEYSVRIHWSR